MMQRPERLPFKTTHFSTFVITHEYSSDFSDVNLRKWFYNEVNTALENGWFKGSDRNQVRSG